MWIGVVSDTHGELHPGIPEALDGMDFIIHCGGIGSMEVLNALSQISPVSGVIGRSDDRAEIPFGETLVREMAGVNVLVSHHVGTPSRPRKEIGRLLDELQPKVLLYGHTLEPFNAPVGDCLWFNPGPGSSGNGNKHVASAGILEIEGQVVRGEILTFED